MKSLVIGMGIGQLYKAVLSELGHTVTTCDSYADADYQHFDQAFKEMQFDTVHICTPNHTHETIARLAAKHGAKIVFVEKPGVVNSAAWQSMVDDHPNTRFMMVKNNQYRDEIKHFQDLAERSNYVKITWNNNNRVPRPGSWFTNKELAFGGVSRDLIPHMLSYYCAFTKFNHGVKLFAKSAQHWQLSDIDASDYGPVYSDGVYNVDDFSELEYKNGNTRYVLQANWRTLQPSDISITFGMESSAVRHELGLCPEPAYRRMIAAAINNLTNEDFWQQQLNQDIWIHKQIENL